MKRNKKIKSLRKLFKSVLRDFFKKEGLLTINKSKTFKSKKNYSRKNKDWKY